MRLLKSPFFLLATAVVFAVTCSITSCSDPAPSCIDGIQNQTEVDVDCGGPCIECPPPAIVSPYYVQARLAGDWVTNQTAGRSACSTTGGLCWSNIIDLNPGWSVFFGIDMDSVGIVQNSDIQALEGTQISFDESDEIHAFFAWVDGAGARQTDFASNQNGSFMNIDAVTADGQTFGIDCWKLTGTFECQVAVDSGSTVAVREGIFAIRVCEEM